MRIDGARNQRPARRRLALSIVALGLALALIPVRGRDAVAATDAARRLVVSPVDETRTVALPQSVRPEVSPANDRGLVPDSLPLHHMLLQLRRPPERQQAFDRTVASLHDPAAAEFHRWLTPAAIARRFSTASADRAAVEAWLESHGFTVNVDYLSGTLIDFSGNAGQVRAAFGTELHYFDVGGVRHFANRSSPRIPAALAPVVGGVVALHDFKPQRMFRPRHASVAAPQYTYNCSGGTCNLVTPADLATIYGLNSLFAAGIDGRGQKIVIVEDTDLYQASDWSTFRATFGLSDYTAGRLKQIHPQPASGGANCSDPGVNADESEAALDVQWASAAAPSAKIKMVSCDPSDTGDGLLLAITNVVSGAVAADVMSLSYGTCEAENGAASNAAYYDAFEQAAGEGISVFVSAGDQNAASCDTGTGSNIATTATHGIGVNGFASTPYDVAVGGTDFAATYDGTTASYWRSTNSAAAGSALSYIPEIPWNDSCASTLIAQYMTGSKLTYGAEGFCNSPTGSAYLTVSGGSGGPSGCAAGAPMAAGVVSGSCEGYAKPAWQSGVLGNSNDGARDLPDVSLFAADGVWSTYYVFCDTNPSEQKPCTGPIQDWDGGGGTSFAAPIMAGIQALVDQNAGSRQGNPNPVYYALGKAEYGTAGAGPCKSKHGASVPATCVFHDVTQGDMDVNCRGSNSCFQPGGQQGVLSGSDSSYEPAFAAHVGWDFATGLGTVNAATLVNQWSAGLAASGSGP